MPRARKKIPVPNLPLRVEIRLRGRVIAEISFGPHNPGDIVPGSVVWHCDPAKVSGPDRERVAAYVVKVAKLDPKIDHDRIWRTLFERAPIPNGID